MKNAHFKKVPEILIVDDTPEHIQFAAAILQGKGYRVRGITDGAMIFETLKAGHVLEARNKIAPDTPFFILTMNMPKYLQQRAFQLECLLVVNKCEIDSLPQMVKNQLGLVHITESALPGGGRL